jgi:hypothetical protein
MESEISLAEILAPDSQVGYKDGRDDVRYCDEMKKRREELEQGTSTIASSSNVPW